jgi:SAM-dependent methyltransferase
MTDGNQTTSSEFYEITKDKPPSPLLVSAVSLVTNKDSALDLGCGAGRDTRYLLDQGFNKVTTVDINQQTKELIESLPNQDRSEYVNSTFSNFNFGHYDLVNAQWSLPFTSPSEFEEVVSKLKQSINPGGVFAGQLFGVNDEWNTPDRKMKFHTREDAKKVFDGMEIIEFREEDKDGTLANGKPKHWHVFHIVARKPLA